MGKQEPSLDQIKDEQIRIARQLGYDSATIRKIREAENEYQISNAMKSGRDATVYIDVDAIRNQVRKAAKI